MFLHGLARSIRGRLNDVRLNISTAGTAGSPLHMAFVMESRAQRDVFAEHTWLSCYDRFEDIDHHMVALYRTL